jgi:hypothetical protein
MTKRTKGLLVGAVMTPPALFLSMLSAGAGHGNYLAASVIYPIPMLLMFLGGPGLVFAGILALIQFPLYGFSIGAGLDYRKKRLIIVPALLLASSLILLGIAWLR